MPGKKDYTGMIFGIFTVIKDLGIRYGAKNGKKKYHYMIAMCKLCKKSREFHIESLRNKRTKCKCQYKPLVTKEWLRCNRIHHHMIMRCYDENDKDYARYGARGIKVCRGWKNNAKAFYEWSIKNGYRADLSIDRINNNKGYSPDNCRWATRSQQQQNRRNSIPIKLVMNVKKLMKDGYSRSEVSKIFNITYDNAKYIDRKNHWDLTKEIH
jgi:hypothetical protein